MNLYLPFSGSENSILLSDKKISLSITKDEKETLARMEHNRWLAEILLEGYTHAPAPANHQLRTHPCCVPWEELEEKDKEKDLAQIDIIPIALLNAGYIPMKKNLAKLYTQLDNNCKQVFENLAIGLLNGGQALVEESKKCDLNKYFPDPSQKNVIIITSLSEDDLIINKKLQDKLSSVLSQFSGIVIISKIAKSVMEHINLINENLQKDNQNKYTLLGYLPEHMSDKFKSDCFDHLIETCKENYSELKPIQYWLDIVIAGINPKQVQFLYFKSGSENNFELELAKTLEAKTENL